MSRFAEAKLENANGIAALALWRALMAYLQDYRLLTLEQVSAIQLAAIDDLQEGDGEVYAEARAIIRHACP